MSSPAVSFTDSRSLDHQSAKERKGEHGIHLEGSDWNKNIKHGSIVKIQQPPTSSRQRVEGTMPKWHCASAIKTFARHRSTPTVTTTATLSPPEIHGFDLELQFPQQITEINRLQVESRVIPPCKEINSCPHDLMLSCPLAFLPPFLTHQDDRQPHTWTARSRLTVEPLFWIPTSK